MIKKFALPVAIAGSLLAGSAVQAASIVNLVDHFQDAQEAFINMPNQGDNEIKPLDVTVSGGLLNGVSRSMELDVVEDKGNKSNSRVPVAPMMEYGFSLSNDVEQEVDATLDYGTFDAVDFTVGGANHFIFKIMTNDHEENLIALTINGITKTVENPDLPVLPFDSNNVEIKLPFSEFDQVDFTQVTSLALKLDAVSEGDMAVSMFATGGNTSTPEPATMLGLLAVGALGFASRRRQK